MSNIICVERIAKGIWIRNPFYKKYFNVYSGDGDHRGNVHEILRERPFTFWAAVHRLLNRKETILGHREFIREDNAAGYTLWSIRNPFYFARQERYAYVETPNISYRSWGWNFLTEQIAGHCQYEYTEVKMKTSYDPKPTKITVFKGRTDKHGSYQKTYKHVIENFLATGKFD